MIEALKAERLLKKANEHAIHWGEEAIDLLDRLRVAEKEIAQLVSAGDALAREVTKLSTDLMTTIAERDAIIVERDDLIADRRLKLARCKRWRTNCLAEMGGFDSPTV